MSQGWSAVSLGCSAGDRRTHDARTTGCAPRPPGVGPHGGHSRVPTPQAGIAGPRPGGGRDTPPGTWPVLTSRYRWLQGRAGTDVRHGEAGEETYATDGELLRSALAAGGCAQAGQ